ncbi:MAG: hypothetical protein AAF757_00120 [Cyanobacteria bacterium P01_D01_bin.116]
MSKNRTEKYMIPFLISAIGGVCIASPLFLKLGSEMPDYIASSEHISEQKRLRTELEERKKTSEKVRETGLVLSAPTLTLSNYLDDSKSIPILRKTDLNRYDKNQKVWVFDASDRCIGIIHNKEFISKHHNRSTCDKIPDEINNGTKNSQK